MDEVTTIPASRFLTNGEAAQYLKLSPRTLEKLRMTRRGPRFRKFGRRVTYAVTDLETWASVRGCYSTSDANYDAVR